MKNCSKPDCLMQNPQPLENFHKNIRAKDGLSFVCKTCKKIYEDEYREKNREIIKVRSKEQRDKNPGAHKEWRDKNPEKFAANQKRFKDKNREEIKKQNLEYYYKNRDRQLNLAKKRRDENIEKERERTKIKDKLNPGAKNARTAKRRAKKLCATPPSLTKEHKDQILNYYIEAAKLTKETGISHHVDHIFPLTRQNNMWIACPLEFKNFDGL